ncbi:MAG: UDP-N-acetylmuramoyl-tripeptide--D-alanyl-D-alanine ligase [Bacteroidales bacterium]|nr:UDP-N-acetylmuramoyl-tripeptide--D-alanyl-D-alanine ligase [Bacteroidales bacterium]
MVSDISKLYEIFLDHPHISTDSRNVSPGSIFFALKGEHFNGNIYAAKALESGASYAVIDQNEFAADSRFIIVDDVLTSLQMLARYHRDQLVIPIIGITGSNGKTTTKELTGNVLAGKMNAYWTKGNLNNHIGVPLSVLSINRDTEIAVIEMGANHCGEIASLCQIADPNFGIITNIGKAHLQGFGGYEGVIRAKSELYDHIRQHGGKLFVNEDDQLLLNLSKGIETITYGICNEASLPGDIISEFPFLSVRIDFHGSPVSISSQLIGSYNFHNIMAAACIGNYFGVSPKKIKDAIEGYNPENNRSQFIRTDRNHIVMDAYNANPSSMEAAITHFAKFPDDRKVLILGDMLELGEESLPEHRRILELALQSGAGQVILIGEIFNQVCNDDRITTFTTSDQAISKLSEQPLTGKTILLKGSRGIRLEKLLAIL